ncbi:MAG: epimerase [Acidobacteriaceae bacterium]
MRVLLFGASGMVGQGVLRECMLDPRVSQVVCVVRRSGSAGLGVGSPKVREVVTDDFSDFTAVQDQFAGCDACFFCLGISSFRMKEPEYRATTYDITLATAQAILRANTAGSSVTFLYVSGAGTDPKSKTMWSRVKGETENALLTLPFRAAYMFRPGLIVPRHGIRSKTAVYRAIYIVLAPVLPLLLRAFPKLITTTEQVGRAMLIVTRRGYPKHILEAADIATCGSASA